MEGRAKKGSYYSPMSLTSPPPISAIDRFLFGKNHNKQGGSVSEDSDPPFTTTTDAMLLPPPTTLDSGGYCEFTSRDVGGDNGQMTRENGTALWHTMQEIEFVDALFSDQPQDSIDTDANHDGQGFEEGKRYKGRKGKSRLIFIKGQWTEEEDSKLTYLVGKYGTRKWSLIAEKLVGRAGKQCRERWHNHLRPDIKKECWSEEEERLLVEAHRRFGNRWAEIARRIPGRTENSIKNHWNATKRRQYSKRKNKRVGVEGGPTSLLQDYIKTLIHHNQQHQNQDPAPNNTIDRVDVQTDKYAAMSSSSISTTLSAADDYVECSTLGTFVLHDELMFNNSASQVENLLAEEIDDPTKSVQLMQNVSNVNTTPSYSDWMVYTLLEGGGQAAPNNMSIMIDNLEHQNSMMNKGFGALFQKKDLDLIEMISSSQFSQASSSSSN